MSCLIVSYCTIPNLTMPALTLTCPTFRSVTLLTSPYFTLTCGTIPYLTVPYPIFIQHHPLQSTTLITLSCPICFSFSKVLDQMKNQWYHLLNMIRIVLRFWELWSRHLVIPSIKFVQSLQCDARTFQISLLLTHCWFSDSPFISLYRFVSLFFLILFFLPTLYILSSLM